MTTGLGGRFGNDGHYQRLSSGSMCSSLSTARKDRRRAAKSAKADFAMIRFTDGPRDS